jgi:multiple sugar transport system substrate-binding protein
MRRDHVRRRRFITAAGAAGLAGLAGCTGGSGGSSDSDSGSDAGSGGGSGSDSDSSQGTATGGSSGGGTIRYLSDRGDSKAVLDAIISEFESSTDYTVEVTFTSKGTSTDQEMQKMVAAGNPPDLFFDTSTDAFRFQQEGVLAPVSDAVSANNLPDPVNVGGESYFAPAIVEPLMGWYRNDIYDENPNEWSSWLEEARRVSENTDMEGYIVQSGQTNNADTQMTQYLWQNDVQIYSGPTDDIEVTVDQGDNRALAVETFEWVQDMAEYSPNGSGWEWGDCINALQQENAAAGVSVGGLPILTMMSNRPDLVENFSPMPFPVADGKAQDKWWAYMEGHLVRSDGDNTQGAREFVEFFSGSDRFFDFILSAPLFQFPPSREQLDAPPMQENETLQRFPEALSLVRDNWDVFTSVLETGDDGAPNLTAAQGYGNQVFGQAADQMLVGGLSPEETVDFLAETLRGL